MVKDIQDAHQHFVVAADDLKVELNRIAEKELDDPKLIISINDKQIEIPLWSADILHILSCTADNIIEFAESQM